MSPSPAVLQASALRSRHAQVPFLEGLDIELAPGITLVRGGEGRGKTTLLRLLAGDPDAGSACARIGAVERGQDATAYRSLVYWVDPRSPDLDPVPVRECLAQLGRRWPPQDAALLQRLIVGFDLQDHLDKAMFMLSTGSRRKVWLAAGLSAGAPVTLFDQPFAALDAASCRFLVEQLNERACEEGRTWVIADYEAPATLELAQVIDLGD